MKKPPRLRRAADLLTGKPIINPFKRSQARDYSPAEMTRDYTLTAQYLDAFENRHQVLLGTRGSGRTLLLRMMGIRSRTELQKRLKGHKDLQAIHRGTMAFYVRLALEWVSMACIGGTTDIRYFHACFNIRACVAFCIELRDFVSCACHTSLEEKANLEHKLAKLLARSWGLPDCRDTDLTSFALDLDSLSERMVIQRALIHEQVLSQPILAPIESVVESVALQLGDFGADLRFYACIDEAEFLTGEFLASVVSSMRSSKRCIIKIATLHYHFDDVTAVPGVRLGLGDDYSILDVDPTPKEFDRICDHLVSSRLGEVGVEVVNLREFLGYEGNDRPIDYFARVTRVRPIIDELCDGIYSQLSQRRKEYVTSNRDMGQSVKNTIELKFAPVYYVREVKKKREGNIQLGFYAGPSVVKSVANRNPRRFLEVMEKLFDSARVSPLSFGKQQAVLMQYSRELQTRAGSLSPLLQVLIEKIGDRLSEKVHAGELVDCGCSFTFTHDLLVDPRISEAIKQGVAHSHLVPDQRSIQASALPERMSLAYGHAVRFWLPLRSGVPVLVGSLSKNSAVPAEDTAGRGQLPRKNAQIYVRQLQLSFNMGDEFVARDETSVERQLDLDVFAVEE